MVFIRLRHSLYFKQASDSAILRQGLVRCLPYPRIQSWLSARLGPLIRPIISSAHHQIHQTHISVLIPEKHPLIRPNPCSGALQQRGKSGPSPKRPLTPLSLLQRQGPKKDLLHLLTNPTPPKNAPRSPNIQRGGRHSAGGSPHLARREENGKGSGRQLGPGI
ncbi:hypothetical protein BDP81DRAFT_80754 [Colletotrichum phormii]|uniref:Uncharacterized protein n=1 Tax=Colletotrichum phormii TaxID=359342 RepID=A0AAJ0A3E4_9PEZI|nr:uncharacterized protein BDP81DRAFT_80754 [Colletotrichum phormii]KAK1654292.1 hypothetical protein BDP81DRAFT_80754 [Colletotrichum phormii]